MSEKQPSETYKSFIGEHFPSSTEMNFSVNECSVNLDFSYYKYSSI